MPTWPPTLPVAPAAGGMTARAETNVAEFKTDVGSPIRRRRYTASRRLYEAEMVLTGSQRAALDSFFADDCSDGVTGFMARDWANPTSPVLVSYSWQGPPSFSHVAGDVWRVSLSVAREP